MKAAMCEENVVPNMSVTEGFYQDIHLKEQQFLFISLCRIELLDKHVILPVYFHIFQFR